MHKSVMEFLRRELAGVDLSACRVLEVGAYDVNGSPRDVIGDRCALYTGIDLRPGTGVDQVCDVAEVEPEAFDLVVSTSTLEHCRDWRAVVDGMKRALAPGGLFLLTAAGPGFARHDHPDDFWRFTPDDFARMLADMEDVWTGPDPQLKGAFARARRPRGDGFEPLGLGAIEVMAL